MNEPADRAFSNSSCMVTDLSLLKYPRGLPKVSLGLSIESDAVAHRFCCVCLASKLACLSSPTNFLAVNICRRAHANIHSGAINVTTNTSMAFFWPTILRPRVCNVLKKKDLRSSGLTLGAGMLRWTANHTQARIVSTQLCTMSLKVRQVSMSVHLTEEIVELPLSSGIDEEVLDAKRDVELVSTARDSTPCKTDEKPRRCRRSMPSTESTLGGRSVRSVSGPKVVCRCPLRYKSVSRIAYMVHRTRLCLYSRLIHCLQLTLNMRNLILETL